LPPITELTASLYLLGPTYKSYSEKITEARDIERHLTLTFQTLRRKVYGIIKRGTGTRLDIETGENLFLKIH